MMTKQPLEVWCTTMSLLRHNPQDVAWLIHESAPELFALIFGSKAIPLLTDFVQRSHNRFSYKNIRVAQAGDRVLGMATILKAEDIHDNADDRTVLSWWEKLRLQLAQRLILSRILQHDYPTGSFYISNLAVHAEYRGRGIGTQLLLQCIADAIAAGASTVFISVDIENSRAYKLYESLGFQVVTTKTMRLFGTTIGSRVLALSIP
ncbi:GNAT family N-acetyltransferase [Dendronalium sp. ChiSLP03b]|uniref:GNAT family N-acetyltransferase n=1 Tax=Dendronalium sp. ChiSLP03b TaxID=3075381 RepID=UPI002AD384E4|nr:GNAT family N-acetyltransferase [Dendronalium sp. ChiSLP03b]MDZ8207990.1 GNAT family N-acetyltransferase [Dendronalium sp. ChiSLP03b]